MNWKTLLVITSLTLSAGLTSCGKEAEAPKTDGGAPAATEAPKGDAAPKDMGKPGDAPKTEAPKGDAAPKDMGKPGDAPKTEAKPGEAKKDAPKKP
jgi:transcription termination factor Rho